MKTDRFEIKLDNCTVIATNDEPAQFPKPHTFPTLQEFKDKYEGTAKPMEDVYNWFRDRVQPLEIGREYEFSVDGEEWVRREFEGYATNRFAYLFWTHIRPIQPDPKQELINRLKAVDDPTGAVADAIKALEGEK